MLKKYQSFISHKGYNLKVRNVGLSKLNKLGRMGRTEQTEFS